MITEAGQNETIVKFKGLNLWQADFDKFALKLYMYNK